MAYTIGALARPTPAAFIRPGSTTQLTSAALSRLPRPASGGGAAGADKSGDDSDDKPSTGTIVGVGVALVALAYLATR